MSPVLKRKPEKSKIPGKYLLLIFTFICMLLMVITFTTDGLDRFAANVFGRVVIPFQSGITNVSNSIQTSVDERRDLEELRAENAALQEQINALISENTLLLQDKYELNNLRELFELDTRYSEYDKIGARIISWESSNWFSSFLIDKGSEDGILVDMNVIAGSGLVGRVVETGPNWARVVAIIDDSSNVSATVLHTQDHLIVSGNLQLMENGVIGFSQLMAEEGTVQIGDKIVTSYISDRYVPGILIGYISSIEMDSNHMTYSGTITPVVDFSHLSEVLVITVLKQDIDE